MLILPACSHRGPGPPPPSPQASGPEISEETLRGLILRLNKRYENVDERLTQNQQRIGALEKEVASLREAVANLNRRRGEGGGARANSLPPLAASTSQPSPAKPDPKTLYESGLSAYSQKNYRKAIARFQQFVNAFPSSDLADNALYWMGESYYAREEFERAISSFLMVVDRYPRGNKVPDALFKTGLSYRRLKDRDKAVEFLTRVMDNYPFSSAARQAKTELDRLE